MAMVVGFLILLMTAPAAYGLEHTVGGSQGWNQNVDYSTWAASQSFAVGDSLLFVYATDHGLEVVNQNDYNSCNTGSPIQTFYGGRTLVNLTTTGPMYFICPTAGHCQQGMKLAINVLATGTNPNGFLAPPPPPRNGGPSRTFGLGNHWVVVIALLVAAMAPVMG